MALTASCRVPRVHVDPACHPDPSEQAPKDSAFRPESGEFRGLDNEATARLQTARPAPGGTKPNRVAAPGLHGAEMSDEQDFAFALLHFCKRFFCCPVTIEFQIFLL